MTFTSFDVKLLEAIHVVLLQIQHSAYLVPHDDIATCLDSIEEFKDKVQLFIEQEKN